MSDVEMNQGVKKRKLGELLDEVESIEVKDAVEDLNEELEMIIPEHFYLIWKRQISHEDWSYLLKNFLKSFFKELRGL